MDLASSLPQAVARVTGGAEAPDLLGSVAFYQKPEGVLVVARIIGLPPNNPSGFFALHIHEGSSCSGSGFSAAGGHYNPGGAAHPAHAGDLPPLLFSGGTAYLSVLTDRFRVRDILGRTVVIHSGPDDFHSQPAGNAGTKIACGVIR